MKRIIEMNLRLFEGEGGGAGAAAPAADQTPLEALGQRKARNWKKHRKSGRQVMKNSRKSIVICMVKT